MKWIIAQYFITMIMAFTICVYPLHGIAAYVHSKIKRDLVWIVSAFLVVAIFAISILCVIIFDETNTFVWYCLSILTIVFADIVLLNSSDNAPKSNNPKKLKEHIHNAKIEYFSDKTIKVLLKSKYLIYPIYILLTILNQLQSLEIVSFTPGFSLYLQVNEYSLIVLFATNEMIKFFKDSKRDVAQ